MQLRHREPDILSGNKKDKEDTCIISHVFNKDILIKPIFQVLDMYVKWRISYYRRLQTY